MNAKIILPEEQNNVLPFVKPDTSGTDENWLAKLELGTCFVCRPKDDRKCLDLMEYHVLHHAAKSSTLYLSSPTGQMNRLHVDQLRFSRAMELVEVLGVTHLEKEEVTDGRDNPVRASDMESHVDDQG